VDGLSRFAPLTGLVAAVTFGAGNAVWAFEQPARDTGADRLLSFYEGNSTEILIGGTISLVSLFFLVWFGAVLYQWLSNVEGAERSGLPLMAFGGAILAAAAGLGAETINMAGAMRADDGELTAEAAQIYFDVSFMFGYTAAAICMAVLAAPIALIAGRTGRPLTSWLAWLVMAVSIVMLIPQLSVLRLFAIPVILLGTLSGRMYRVGPEVLTGRPANSP
jgi:hypothetical protein